jgi:pyrroloquinoline-quinone synthase
MRSVVEQIHGLVAERRLLDHPFYTAWSHGELSPEILRKYAEQYYHWVQAFPTWLSAAHSNASDLAMRQEILANLNDEEMGDDNHPELWLRFCDALGLDRAAVKSAELLPETREAIATMRRVCRDEPAVAGLSALYAYESQQPEVMKTKREGLRDLYQITSGHEYFEVHEAMDVVHSAGERKLIEASVAGHEAEALAAAKQAIDATYTILNGIERVRQESQRVM